MAASPMLKNTDFPIDERGPRSRERQTCASPGDDGVVEGAWAAGDNAAVPDLSAAWAASAFNAQHASARLSFWLRTCWLLAAASP